MRSPVLLLIALCACNTTYEVPEQATASRPFAWAIDNPQKRSIELWLHQGHILVESTRDSGDLVNVSVDVTVHAPTAKEAVAWLEGVNQSRASIDEHAIKLSMTVPLGAPLNAVDLKYSVRVPEGSDLRIYTKTGEVALRGYRGKVLVESDSGQISARLAGGDATFRSTTGPIRIEGDYRKAQLKTASGSLEVVMPDTKNPVDVWLESQGGPMQIEVADALAMKLDYSSSGGKFACELPIRYEDGQDSALDGGQRFIAFLGKRETTAETNLTILSDKGNVDLRRLPAGSK